MAQCCHRWQLFFIHRRLHICANHCLTKHGDCDIQKSGLVHVVAMVSTERSWYASRKESADGNI